jgi:membrane-associated phospholipid phosphatase
LPEWVLNAIPLAVDPAYGQELVRLGLEGVDHLSPANILGLIGFPSFHIFMALMSVFFVPRHRLFIVVIGALNILMLPAVLVQGGHHLSDVFGGMACFAVAFPLSRYIVKTMSNTPVYNTAQQRPLDVAAE